jgi:4-hydroxy-tetrahydrodipicolinate synthase
MSELITAMVTIFKDDLSVDYDACIRLADFLIENGSDGLVVSGTTGESPTLTNEEKLTLFSKIKKAVGDKAKVLAGTGSNCTDSTVRLTKEASKTSVDGIMLVTPYYNKPPQDGLIQHFKTIAEATELPIMMYNVPSRTGSNMEASTTIVLSEVGNITSVKEASGDIEQVKQIINNTSGDFKVYSGDDSSTYDIMKLGGDGVVSVASHVVGNLIKEMLNCCSNNQEKAKELNNKLMPLFEGLFKTTNPILVKAALELIGQKGGPLRLPLIEATLEQKTELKILLDKIS